MNLFGIGNRGRIELLASFEIFADQLLVSLVPAITHDSGKIAMYTATTVTTMNKLRSDSWPGFMPSQFTTSANKMPAACAPGGSRVSDGLEAE